MHLPLCASFRDSQGAPTSTGSLKDVTAEANPGPGWLEGSLLIPEDWPEIFSVVLGGQIWCLCRGPGFLLGAQWEPPAVRG